MRGYAARKPNRRRVETHETQHKGEKNRRTKARYHLPVVVEQEADGVFIVSIPTLRGCRSYGYTLDEAMANIAEAAALCLEGDEPPFGGTFIGVRDLEIRA